MSFAEPTREQTDCGEFLAEYFACVEAAPPFFRHAINDGHILFTARTAIGEERARWSVNENGVAIGSHDPDGLVPVWHRRLQSYRVDPRTGCDDEGYEPAPPCDGHGRVDLGAGGLERCDGCEECRPRPRIVR